MNYSYTPAQARDHIYSTFYAVWRDPVAGWQGLKDADGNPIYLAQEPKLEWDNDIDDSADVTEPTVYLYIRHYTSKNRAIGGRAVERKGFVLVKVKVPSDTGLKTADALSYIVKTAFENKRAPGDGKGILFRTWRPTETGIVQSIRFQIVSTVDFEYDELSS